MKKYFIFLSYILNNIKKIYFFVLLIYSPLASTDYKVGDGLNIGNVYISGYNNTVWEAPNGQPQTLSIDDLSLFVSAQINKYINPFLEVEIAGASLWDEGRGIGFRRSRLVLERIYNDIQLDEEINIRLGKSLAPVGEWNRIHAAPLVWTTNRPITTHFSFSESISGLNIQYTQHTNSIYQFYFQVGEEWVKKPLTKNRPRRYKNIFGFTFDKYSGFNNKIGFSAQHSQVVGSGDKQWLFSLDGQWQSSLIDLEFQTTYTAIDFKHSTNQTANEWGGYIQAIWHVNEEWHFVLRPEYFEARTKESQSSILYGLVYRPEPALSFKLEYMDINHRQSFGFSQGFFASLAVLF